MIAEFYGNKIFPMQFLWASRFAGCSLFQERCRSWYLKYRCVGHWLGLTSASWTLLAGCQCSHWWARCSIDSASGLSGQMRRRIPYGSRIRYQFFHLFFIFLQCSKLVLSPNFNYTAVWMLILVYGLQIIVIVKIDVATWEVFSKQSYLQGHNPI